MKLNKHQTEIVQESAVRHMRACLDCLEGHIASTSEQRVDAIQFFLKTIREQERFIRDTLPQPDRNADHLQGR